MAQPTKKFYGSLSLDGVKKAVTNIAGKVTDHEKFGKQIKINAAQWEDGGISLDIWDAEKKESISLGRLMLSQFDTDGPSSGGESKKDSEKDSEKDDLPF